MANPNFKIVLDVLSNLSVDKSQIGSFSQDLTTMIKKINPSVKIDTSKVAGQVTEIISNFDKLEQSVKDLDKAASDIDIDIQTDKVNEAIKQLQTLLNNTQIDGSEFISFSDSDVKAFANELGKSFSSQKGTLQNFANDVDKAKAEAEEFLKSNKKIRDDLKASGKEGTAEYAKVAKAIDNAEKELKELSKATATVGDATNKISLADKFASVGLATQGIESFASGLSQLAEPYMQLDFATQQIKTLGGEATQNAEKFKAASLTMANSIGIDAQAIQGATYDALSAGIDASEQSISAFMEASGKLAVGGNVAIGDTVNLLSSMLNSYGASANQTKEYSDILFQTVNLGKISVGEMVSSMSQVVPTASAMGYSLKDVGVSLAILTANGVPAAQATTKLNQLLVEMQKPGAKLSKILTKAGLSAASLGAQIKSGDVVGALGSMKSAFEAAGVSATQAFSSTEASAAFNVLTKDMGALVSTTEAFNNSTGATEAAFKEMEGSITNRAAALKRNIETTFMQIADSSGVFGTIAVTFAQSTSQIAPMLSSITQMKTLIGDISFKDMKKGFAETQEKVVKFGEGFKTIGDNMKKALDAKGISEMPKSFKGMATAVDTVGRSLLSKLFPSLVTTTAAQTGLNTAAAANPMGATIAIIVVALAALAGAIYGIAKLWSYAFPSNKEQLNNLREENKELAKRQSNLQKQGETNKKNNDLLKQYENLASKSERTAEEQKKLNDIQLQIAKDMPGTIDVSKSYAENLENVKTKSEALTKAIANTDKSIREIKTQKLQLEIDIENKKLDVAAEGLADKFESATFDAFGNITIDKTVSNSINSQIAKIKVEKDPAKAKQMTEDLKANIFNSKRYAEMSAEDQEAINKSLTQIENATGQRLVKLKERMKVQSADLGVKIGGGLLNYDSADVEKQIQKIANDTGRGVDEVRAEVEKKTKQIRDEKIGVALGEMVQVQKGKTDLSGLDELVTKFKTAKTAVEKENYAEAIQKMAPDAIKWTGQMVGENGKLVDSYELQADKIDAAKDKENERLNGKNKDAVKSYVEALAQEGAEYVNNQKKIADLQKQIETAKASGDTEGAAKLEKQYNTLISKNKAYQNDLIQNAVKWKNSGHSMEQTAEMFAKSLAKSPEEVKKLILQQEKSINKIKEQTQLNERLNKSFKDVSSGDQKNLDANVEKLKDAKDKLDVINKSYGAGSKEAKKQAAEVAKLTNWTKDSAKAVKRNNDISASAQKVADNILNASKGTTAEKKTQVQIAKENFDLESANLENEKARQKLQIESIKNDTTRQRNLNSLETKSAEKKLELFETKYKNVVEEINENTGTITFKAGISNKDQQEVISQFLGLVSSLKSAVKAETDFNLNCDIKVKENAEQELQKEIDATIAKANESVSTGNTFQFDLNVKQLESYREVMFNEYDAKTQELKNQLEKDIADITNDAGLSEDEKNARIKESTEKFNSDKKKVLEDYQKFETDIYKVISDGYKSFESEKTKGAEDEAKRRKEILDKEIDAQKGEIDKLFELYKTFSTAYSASKKTKIDVEYSKDSQKQVDKFEDDKKKLDKLKDEGALSDDEYNQLVEDKQEAHNKRMEKLEEKHQAELLRIENMQKGEDKFLELEKQREELAIQIAAAQSELIEAKKAGDAARVSEIEESLSNYKDQLENLSEPLKGMIDGLGLMVSESMGNLFAGDPDAAKESMKAYLTQLAGYLKAQISAFVLSLVLSDGVTKYLSALPFPLNVASIPIITATIKGAVNAIADPLLSAVTSFSTGGRVDSPTLAVVGDASNLGSSNREWIFRDEQLSDTIRMANSLSAQNNETRLARIEKLLANQELKTTLKGTDIVISQSRTKNRINGRAR